MREGRGIPGCEEAGLVIEAEDLATATNIRPDHDQPGQHGLDNRPPEGFGPDRREEEHVEVVQNARDVLPTDLSRKLHLRAEAVLTNEGAKARLVLRVPRSHDGQPDPLGSALLPQEAQGFDSGVNTLVGDQAAEVEQAQR